MDVTGFSTTSCENRGGNWLVKLGLLAVVLVISAYLAHVLYIFRFRDSQMAFGLYYRWAQRFVAGIDPWRRTPPCDYPPAFVMIVAALVHLGRTRAYWLWQGIQVAAFFATVALVIWESGLARAKDILIVLCTAAILMPYLFTGTLYEAEPTAFLMAALVASWVLARHHRPAAAGFMLALATVLKVYPVVAGGYFLFRRRFGVVTWGAIWTLIVVVITGPERWVDSLLHGAIPFYKVLEWFSIERAVSMPMNVYALGAKLPVSSYWQGFVIVAIIAILGSAILLSSAILTWTAADIPQIDGLSLGLWLCAMLMLSPIAWDHEITLILPIFLFVVGYLVRQPRIPWVGLVLFVVGMLCFVLPYYSSVIRGLHLYFIGVITEYVACGILIRAWSEQVISRRVESPLAAESAESMRL